MTNPANIESALIKAAKEFLIANETIVTASKTHEDLPTIDFDSIAWENKNFDTKRKNPWASVFYVPNTPRGLTIGQRGLTETTGFMQIDLNYPANTGSGELKKWEEKTAIYFHIGRPFTYNGQSVLVLSAGMGQGRAVQNFYRKSITVNFRSQSKREEVL